MLGQFEIIAGDFPNGKNAQFCVGIFILGSFFNQEKIEVAEVDILEIASEENVKKMGGTVGWGIAGAALLGPLGLLAGLLLGGKSKQVTFICQFKDGRKFLAIAHQKIYTKIQAAIF